MPKPLFHGVCASSITPFGSQGALELTRLGPHLDWLIAEGVDAISPLGSSGEFVAMECEDRKKVLATALEKIAGRVHVVAGTHDYSTRRTIELSQFAQSHGADSLLIVPPYYMAPTPSQVMDHYRRIAESVSIPIVLYHNIPLTAVDLKTDHLLKLYEEKAIGGIKMSNPEPDRICEILQATDSQLHIYAGIDTVAFEGLCHGAHGWISGIPSTVPRAAKELYVAIAVEKNLDRARLDPKHRAPRCQRTLCRHRRGKEPRPSPLALDQTRSPDAIAVPSLPFTRRRCPLVLDHESRFEHDRPSRRRSRTTDRTAP